MENLEDGNKFGAPTRFQCCQNSNDVLLFFLSRHSRALRRRVDCARADGSRRHPTQMEGIPEKRKLFWRELSPWGIRRR